MAQGQQVNLASEIKQFRTNMNQEHLMMDVEELGNDDGSPEGKKKHRRGQRGESMKEETVEDLIAKLESKGKKVLV